MPNHQGIQLVPEGEAARIIGQSVQTLRNNRCARRGLPYIKLGRSIRYKMADILAYIEALRIDPEAI